MTVIARFEVRGIPMLVGDALLSAEPSVERSVSLPLIPGVNRHLPTTAARIVAGMTQKLNIVTDRLTIAWAGSYEQAVRTFSSIRPVAERANCSADDIQQVIEDIDPHHRNQLHLLGYLSTPEGNGHRFQFLRLNVDRRYGGPIGDLYIAGTGDVQFVNVLADVVDMQNPSATSETLPWAFGATLIGHLVRLEWTDASNILSWWGGAFEVATIRRGRFEKIGNILHLFLTYEPSGNLRLHPLLYKMDYWQDILTIRAIQIGEHGRVTREDLHLIQPIFRRNDEYNFAEFRVPSLKCQTLCAHVFIENSRGDPNTFVHVKHQNDGVTDVTILETDSKFDLLISDRLVHHIRSSIDARLHNPD